MTDTERIGNDDTIISHGEAGSLSVEDIMEMLDKGQAVDLDRIGAFTLMKLEKTNVELLKKIMQSSPDSIDQIGKWTEDAE